VVRGQESFQGEVLSLLVLVGVVQRHVRVGVPWSVLGSVAVLVQSFQGEAYLLLLLVLVVEGSHHGLVERLVLVLLGVLRLDCLATLVGVQVVVVLLDGQRLDCLATLDRGLVVVVLLDGQRLDCLATLDRGLVV